ncbi:MAG: DUF6851 domain-containing protein, partial [Acidobacteriota bacterium]
MSFRTPASFLCLALSAAVALSAGGAWKRPAAAEAQATDNPVLVWDEAVLHGIRATKPGPTIVARSLAVAHTAMFDAWAAYDARAVPTIQHPAWRRPAAERTEANKFEAVSYAGYRAVVDLYPSEAAYYQALMLQQGYSPADQTTDLSTARGVGNIAAASVLDFRHRDGSNQLGDRAPGAYSDYTGYAPVNTTVSVNDPNHWQPLALVVNGAIVNQTFTTPHWGLVTPFALPSGSAVRPAIGPPQYPDPEYKVEADEVLAFSAALTDDQKVMAEYFADGPT